MDGVFGTILELILEVIIFFIMVGIGILIYKWVKVGSVKLFDNREVLPEDEIHTLKQVFYLIIMSLAFVDIIYSLMHGKVIIYIVIFDIVLSVFLAINLDKSSLKGKLILLLLVPFESLNLLMFNVPLIRFVDIIHILVFAYFVKVYYDKFRQYTESNSLGITILILYVIVFVSFIVTQIVEGVNPLDSLVMVSNAFTSNGYSVLGSSIGGKLNAIVLVWGGYILSGVGTATLAATILMKHFNHKFRDMEESNKELKESIDELKESNRKLEELIKNNDNSNNDS